MQRKFRSLEEGQKKVWSQAIATPAGKKGGPLSQRFEKNGHPLPRVGDLMSWAPLTKCWKKTRRRNALPQDERNKLLTSFARGEEVEAKKARTLRRNDVQVNCDY